MRELDKKQKIVVIAILVIIAGAILYYVYGKDETSYQTEILPYEENVLEETAGVGELALKSDTSEEELEEEEEIIIYITGEVNKEGVYALPEGARIADAIEQAEGLTENAYTEDLNLAYVLEDGMKIKIPNREEVQDQRDSQKVIENSDYITIDSGISIEETQAVQTKIGQKVNINTASEQELETLTGIGPSLAGKIIQYRKENGNFKSVDDIKNVSGIGESKFENIKDKICVN